MSTVADITVIVTAHNYGRYVDACLSSIVGQTLPPKEIIVVDDASEDDTEGRIRRFPEVRYCRVAFRNGNKARNYGFQESDSAFVLFFDADNHMAPQLLDELYGALQEHPETDFAYCDRVNFGEGDTSWYPQPMGLWRSRPFDPQALRKFNYIDLATLMRSRIFPGFDEGLRRFQDWDLWLTVVLERRCTGHYVPMPLYHYRVHDASLSRNEDADTATYHIRRKHGLGAFFRVAGAKNSVCVYRSLRNAKRLWRRLTSRGDE